MRVNCGSKEDFTQKGWNISWKIIPLHSL